jgi:hypothetical protein
MWLRREPEKYIAGAALDRAGLDNVGFSTSNNPTGLHACYKDTFTCFYFFPFYGTIFYTLCENI